MIKKKLNHIDLIVVSLISMLADSQMKIAITIFLPFF